MPKMIFVNLPSADLAASERFYTAIGCTKNEQFSNEMAISMVWSDTITFMLLTHDFFKSFLSKPLADAHKETGALIALSFDTREDIDAINEKAAANGGRIDIRPVQDMGFMYSRAFEDPDGHVFEPVWMDMSAFPTE